MRNKIEFFYDFTCPFCVKFYKILQKTLLDFPDLKIAYSPAEAYPRPSQRRPHSDLAIEAFHAAIDLKGDPDKINIALFIVSATYNIEDPNIVIDALNGVVATNKIRKFLASHKYAQKVLDTNERFEKSGGNALPALRCGEERLDSIKGIGLSEERLRAFLKKVSNSATSSSV